jgi:hypothetical protein
MTLPRPVRVEEEKMEYTNHAATDRLAVVLLEGLALLYNHG